MFRRILVLLVLMLALSMPFTAFAQEMVSGPGEFPIVDEPITLTYL